MPVAYPPPAACSAEVWLRRSSSALEGKMLERNYDLREGRVRLPLELTPEGFSLGSALSAV